MKYCTYLTIYKGNKLPPFYIGYSRIDKVEKENYNGTVTSKEYSKIFKNERMQNPDLFRTIILSKHETISEAKSKETKLQTMLNVAKNPLYINKHIQGQKYCIDRTGITHTEEAKRKMSNSRKHRPSGMKGKTNSTETKNKISQKLMNRIITNETKIKMSAAMSGRHWWTNGIKDVFTHIKPDGDEWYNGKSNGITKGQIPWNKGQKGPSGELNPFYGKKHTEETKTRISQKMKKIMIGRRWWNNGNINKRQKECPGVEWVLGRLMAPEHKSNLYQISNGTSFSA